MGARPSINNAEFGAWLEAKPGADKRQEFKYCDLMTAMPDADEEEVSRLTFRYDLPLCMYKPPKDWQFPGAVGFELIVALASRFVSRIAERADLSPQERQDLGAVQAAVAGLPRTRPGSECGATLRYLPPAPGEGLLKHYFSLELAPDRLRLAAGEFDEANDHNETYCFELDADGHHEERGWVGFWVEGIEQTGDPSYEGPAGDQRTDDRPIGVRCRSERKPRRVGGQSHHRPSPMSHRAKNCTALCYRNSALPFIRSSRFPSAFGNPAPYGVLRSLLNAVLSCRADFPCAVRGIVFE